MASQTPHSGADKVDPVRMVWRRYLAAKRAWRIRSFLRAACTLAAATPAEGKTAAVVVTPWPVWDQAPEYMMTIALALRLRGVRAELVWDDMPFDGERAERTANERIETLLPLVERAVSATRTSEYALSEHVCLDADATIDEYARLNAHRRYKCETLDDSGLRYHDQVRGALLSTTAALCRLFAARRFDYVVACGGLYRSTSAVVHAARKSGVRVATIDSGLDTLLVATNGVAAYLDDVPAAMDSVKDLDTEWDVRAAHEECVRRQRGKDRFSYQAVRATSQPSSEYTGCVLIALNQSFDTSALGRHCVYRSQTEWLIRSVEWLLANSQQRVVVRRHPIERKRGMRSNDDYEGVLRQFMRSHPSRLMYIDEKASVSTYDILLSAGLVLVHTSSVGMEATMRGIPVVTQSRNAYSGLGFVWHAGTQTEYHALLDKGTRGKLKVTPEAMALASRCYYITQCCNFAHVPEAPNALPRWSGRSARQVLSSPQLGLALESIDSGVPLSLTAYLQHRRAPSARGA